MTVCLYNEINPTLFATHRTFFQIFQVDFPTKTSNSSRISTEQEAKCYYNCTNRCKKNSFTIKHKKN